MRRIDQLHRMLVVIEGPDGSGKTELVKELRRLYDMQLYVFDRFGPAPCYVYDDLLNRPANVRRNYVGELQVLDRAFDLRQILLMATPVTLLERINQRRTAPTEIEKVTEKDTAVLRDQLTLYNRWSSLSARFILTHTIWTDNRTLVEVGQLAKSWIDSTLEERKLVE